MERAISDMPDSFVIKTFLEMHRSVEKGMLLTEHKKLSEHLKVPKMNPTM